MGSWHDRQGRWTTNLTKFPDLKQMVDYGHSKGVQMDFYLNQDIDAGWHNCKSEGAIEGAAANTGNPRYISDMRQVAEIGFDGVKFDGGGGNDNMTLWAEAANATGREILLENCNNGGYVPYYGPGKHAGVPDQGCPFNMFRVGSDIAPSPLSVVSNLIDAAQYLNESRPGCWAYPDMLELGAPVVGLWAATSPRNGPGGPPRKSLCSSTDGTVGDTGPRLSFEQGKTQFAAWCTVSSPLILGFDLANETEYDRWWPVISNPRALAVQADWAGLAGRLVATGPQFTTCVPHGASCETLNFTNGHKTGSLPVWSVWGKPLSDNRYVCLQCLRLLGAARENSYVLAAAAQALPVSLSFINVASTGPGVCLLRRFM